MIFGIESSSDVLCDNKIQLKIKEKFCKMVIRPALLYSKKGWAIMMQASCLTWDASQQGTMDVIQLH